MKHTRIKICGITSEEAVRAALEAGVDALGFVFTESPRQLSPLRAAELARDVPPSIVRVAVFAHARTIDIQRVLNVFDADVVQTEPHVDLYVPVTLLPVFHDDDEVLERIAQQATAEAPVLLEAAGRGGRGIKSDWNRAASIARTRRLVLAGGLHPENVGDAMATVRPFAVDVSSGVESEPGKKETDLMRAFVHAVREADKLCSATLNRKSTT